MALEVIHVRGDPSSGGGSIGRDQRMCRKWRSYESGRHGCEMKITTWSWSSLRGSQGRLGVSGFRFSRRFGCTLSNAQMWHWYQRDLEPLEVERQSRFLPGLSEMYRKYRGNYFLSISATYIITVYVNLRNLARCPVAPVWHCVRPRNIAADFTAIAHCSAQPTAG